MVTLRPIRDDDQPDLYRIYASTRQEELARVNWDDTQKETFLRQQFNAQHQYYHSTYPDAEYQVIEADGHTIGRLYVDRPADHIHIIDIALLPENRNGGTGGALMKTLLAEAEEKNKVVRIYVEQQNPALRFYERLGFTRTGDTGVYYLMEWSPDK